MDLTFFFWRLTARGGVIFLLTYFGGIKTTIAQELTPMAYTDSVDFLLTLAAEKPGDPNSLEMAKRAIEYAREHQYRNGEAKAHFVFGRIYSNKLLYEAAIEAYVQSSRIYEALDNSVNAGKALNAAASIYIYNLDHSTKAYEYCSRAMELLKDDSVAMQPVITNLAGLALRMGKPDKALPLYELNYRHSQRLNKPVSMCIALNNIATCYEYKKAYQKSIAYYEKALEISTTLDDHKQSAHILLGLQSSYCLLNDHKKAYELTRLAEKIVTEQNLHDKHVIVLQMLAAESEHGGQLSVALKYAQEALHFADSSGLRMFLPGIFHQLSGLYAKTGAHELALKYLQRYGELKDSIAYTERVALASRNTPQTTSALPTGFAWKQLTSQRLIVVFLLLGAPTLAFIYYRTKRKGEESPSVDVDNTADIATVSGEDLMPGAVEETTPASEVMFLEVINGQGMKLVALEEICWIQKEGKNYFVHTAKGIYRLRKNISEVEEALPKHKFFRINRTVIINTLEMSNYSFWENHKYIVRMKDEKKSEFVISRNRLREMRESFLGAKSDLNADREHD